MSEKYIWYIEPKGCIVTNRLLSKHLPAENACIDKRCSDGKERDLWRCEHSTVAELDMARSQLNLNFKVFVQNGPRGKIKPWKFGRRKRKILIPEPSMPHHD